MNKFILEPTDENLERLKKIKGKEVYWHTADFYQFDPSLRENLSVIYNAYVDLLMKSMEEDIDDEEAERQIQIKIGKMLVKAARKKEISSQDYRDQFNNFATVMFTPILIWRKDEMGKISCTRMSNI